jgi:hypothetical protein
MKAKSISGVCDSSRDVRVPLVLSRYFECRPIKQLLTFTRITFLYIATNKLLILLISVQHLFFQFLARLGQLARLGMVRSIRVWDRS